MPVFYDTHAHLDFPDFSSDLPQVVERAQAAGIERIVSIGTCLESSRRAIDLAECFECIYAVVGWHPCDALSAPDDLRPALRELAKHPKVVAIGETGLDYYRLPSQTEGKSSADDVKCKEKQAAIFRQQLEVAAEYSLNCVIHQRSALEDTLALLNPFAKQVRGVFHCFVDSLEARQRITALGSFVSFTGIATFKNAESIRDVIRGTPANEFMLETDSPYLAPVPYRGKRCEPAYVKQLAESVAGVKGISLEELSAKTCAVARRFFPRLK